MPGPRTRSLRLLPVVAVVAWSLPTTRAAEPTPEAVAHFEKEVRPLLVEKCQRCHGAKKQEAGLRLDSRAAVLKGGENGPAVVPGKADKGTLLPAIRHTGDVKMPQSGKLPDARIAAVAKWVTDGAAWPEEKATAARPAGTTEADRNHWAFRPVADPPPPAVRDAAWPLTDVDRFILARLEAAGIKPAAAADKRTLLRRATFDLTGLPPTPEEIRAFLADETPGAFERVVERLLASKHYGERWGRHWLDVARYADTAGDGADYPVREAYKYRNWVIDAFNADVPYDQFLREQIAGDLIARDGPPEKYASRVTATGFLAVGKRYGYAPNPDFQHLDFADVIESTGRSLLGLSIGCARCHDHKYEPLTVADYYGLYGILQSTKWSFPGGEEHKRPANLVPLVAPEEAARRDKAKADELAKFDAEIGRLKAERGTLDGKAVGGGADLGFEGQALGKAPGKPWLSEGTNTVSADAQSPLAHLHPAGTRGVRLDSGKPTDGVRYVLDTPLKATPNARMHFAIDFRTVAPTDKTGAYRFYVGRGVIASLAVECSVTATEFAVRSGAKWEVVRKLEPGTWYTLQLAIDPGKKTYSGVVGKPGDLTAFADKGVGPAWDGVIDTFICDAIGHVAGAAPARDLDNVALQAALLPAPGGEPVKPVAAPADLKERLAKIDAALAEATKLRAAAASAEPYPMAYGVSEGVPGNARVQLRGEPERPGPEVPRRFVGILGGDPLPRDAKGSGRLELADWVTRPTNPLTARVFVNRVWQGHFGRGLVATSSDFGTRGELPTHPELLDALATRFVKSGWSVKELHRLILRSRVYQLAGADDPSAAKADPENKLLSRFPRRGLDAESIRDAMLAASGRLNRDTPAGHPFPDVNTWGFTIHAPFHAVYDSDHRSVYLMVQRNRRHPFLALFDAADPNLSVGERLPTTTPTQALYLMNAPFVHTQAEAFARRLLAAPGDDAARIRLAFETTHGRVPDDAAVADALAFLKAYRAKAAERGLKPDQQAVAAWSALGRVLLTANAFLFVD
ncbi:PSD1 and planctomycete cytochrome C domain-containing protein [Gemmata sp.]|uniref:PSD1 and planctomycete cytochrome C domain-containing protein n=1 Tax=Gemmata sp. TaxID=1914242 RepID=UPI003F6EE8A0